MAKENATEEEMTAALKTACAWAFVSSLPNGVNTKITEHGGGLSEEQAQRIAIARAVLRGAPILLLDEATSALDEKTEAQVLKNLLTALPDTACILTTHRPGALKYCTRLYKAENGALTCIMEQTRLKDILNAFFGGFVYDFGRFLPNAQSFSARGENALDFLNIAVLVVIPYNKCAYFEKRRENGHE